MTAEIKGLLIKKQGERAEVKVDRTKTTVTGIPKYLDCWCPINAKVGDTVGVEYRELEKSKSNLVIYGYSNSYAEAFAGINSIPFVALDGRVGRYRFW